MSLIYSFDPLPVASTAFKGHGDLSTEMQEVPKDIEVGTGYAVRFSIKYLQGQFSLSIEVVNRSYNTIALPVNIEGPNNLDILNISETQLSVPFPATSGGGFRLMRETELMDNYPNINKDLINKVNVVFENNLEEMQSNWTEVENKEERRLVHFERRIQGDTISISCRAITSEQYRDAPNNAVVSCISGSRTFDKDGEIKKEDQEKGWYYTSTDLVNLLEKLVSEIPFARDEKDRIRRNVCNMTDIVLYSADEFHNRIYLYKAPAPLKIRREVKIFDWCSLSDSIRKVFGDFYVSVPEAAFN